MAAGIVPIFLEKTSDSPLIAFRQFGVCCEKLAERISQNLKKCINQNQEFIGMCGRGNYRFLPAHKTMFTDENNIELYEQIQKYILCKLKL